LNPPHHIGDSALNLLADILREHRRQTDTIARLGGDEFALLMPNTPSADCNSLCQRLSETIANRMAEATFDVTASIGHATFDQAPESTAEALQKADHAMYAAKARGKNCAEGYIFS
jgi:diguanylate cyclase (GGDEF)-like protein